ncbi:mitochondrial import inner membrane translocase subunit Tim21 isoform X1 [Vespa velutina]|uniref:mitochondrial import inner membrane translocase subunit Tim21 isoform X1 n=1 Tax=Vespa velutina TaxID=202808 RepID=UPI001FB52EA3|nr:mitochondrial import inner membrane translocase subunit Tim21 isoform X1 [Vespa velutina]
MILLRGLTCILLRRYRITRVSNNSYFCCYNVAFNVNVKQCQWYSTKRDVTKIDSKDTKNKVSTDFVEVVKQNTISAGYLVIIAVGITLSIYIGYSILHELFSSNSPYGIYNRALDRCQKNTKVLDALGEPIKVYGEGRRRRNHFSHGFYEKDGTKYLRLKFYMEGIRRRGTVYVEAKNVSDNYEFTYIYMKLDDVLGSVLTIEPNEK